ncbi:MAG: hypothetical protein RLZZ435_247 [Cyanobacteriota bacterium]|jgi:hypothetical protein
MPLDSPYYIQRPSDRLGLATIENQGVTLSITGTRQVGKTSLLARLLAAAQNQGKQKVSLDFQGWEKEALRETELFYRRFCAQLSARLDLSDRVEACWQKYGGAGSSYCCSRYVQDYLLEQVVQRGAKGLVIALDEVETLIDAPFRSEFFGLLRSWHNARAAEPNMKALDLILVSSTEPYELIEDLNQSPFNVGTELKLEDFTLAETEQLNAAYQQPLQADELAELYKRVGGHPYLTAQVLAQVASNQISRMQLWQTAHQETGVFGSHLVYHRLRLEKRSELLEGMQLIAQGKARQVSKDVAIRLEMAGLVKSSPKGYVPRCGIYELYFRDLSANSAPELPSESGNSSPNPRSTEGNRGGNPWTSGSFYLLVAVVVMSLVAAISRAVDLIVLPIVLVSGVLVVMVIGAFQLRQDDRFSEAGFVTLMQETLKRLPLIRKVMPPSSDKKS